ncbi:hypothetical protein [Salininema proteolyticum]|uniref:DUF3592 domain-containing protein n=1 Tax=Salininema proteolyticum TaxID=1607685 RepID=A0ABV8U2V0_9ACTN
MPDHFLPSVLLALVTVLISLAVIWTVAWFFAKVVRWPSQKSVTAWVRRAEHNPNASGPATPRFIILMLGLFLPAFLGFGISLRFNGPDPIPEYIGVVIEEGPCHSGAWELWWLHRCEATVAVDDGVPTSQGDNGSGAPGTRDDRESGTQTARGDSEPGAPAEPVTVTLLSRHPVAVGDMVGLEIRVDEDSWDPVGYEWDLMSESDRPSLFWGALAGWLIALALSFQAGLWWKYSRPRPSRPV